MVLFISHEDIFNELMNVKRHPSTNIKSAIECQIIFNEQTVASG